MADTSRGSETDQGTATRLTAEDRDIILAALDHLLDDFGHSDGSVTIEDDGLREVATNDGRHPLHSMDEIIDLKDRINV